MKKLLLASIAVLFCFSLVAQTAMLKMSLEKNKVYRFRSLTSQSVSQTVNGIQQTTESNVNYVLSLKMIDATPDFMIAEVHFDTLITRSNAMGRQINISSAVEGDIKSSETSEIMSCIMNRLSKNAVFSKIDFTGKPLEVLNAAILSDMILKDTSSITLTGPVAAAVKNQLVAAVSDNTLKTMIGLFTWYLPGKQVSKGEEWTIADQLNSGGMLLDVRTVFHLDGVNADLASVSAESNVKTAENARPIQSGGATVTYDNLQGTSKSALIMDIHTGLIVENKGKSHISGELGISGPGFSMQMPMDINSETTVTALQ